MNGDHPPTGAVVVNVDRSAAGHRALRWGTAQARRTGAPLFLSIAAGDAPPDVDRSLFAQVLAAVGERRAGCPVADRLRELSAEASMVVVPATFGELTELVAGSYAPVVAVPERGGDEGPVVLGAAPWTGDEVFDQAFREAAERGAELIAVRTWSDRRLDVGRVGRVGREQLRSWDRATENARRELDLSLSPWRVIYPTVRVEEMVVQDRPTEFLLDLSMRARLLVLGRSARGALLGLIAGSPAVDLLGEAQCPVLVMPAAGPPRTTLLPRDPGRTRSGS